MSNIKPRFTHATLEHSFWGGGDLVRAMEAAAAYAKTVKPPLSVTCLRSEESDEGFEVILSLSSSEPVQVVTYQGDVLWAPWINS